MAKQYLEAQIADRQRQLAELDRQRLVLEIELRTYQDALAHLVAPDEPQPRNREPETVQSNTLEAPSEPEPKAAQDSRPKVWRAVLEALVRAYPEPLSNEQLFEIAQPHRPTLKRIQLRGQLFSYRERELVESVATGFHRITEKGAKSIGATLPQVGAERRSTSLGGQQPNGKDAGPRARAASEGPRAMAIYSAVEEYLRHKGRRAQSRELVDALAQKGITFGGKKPSSALASWMSAAKDRFDNVPDQGYGLKEWAASPTSH